MTVRPLRSLCLWLILAWQELGSNMSCDLVTPKLSNMWRHRDVIAGSDDIAIPVAAHSGRFVGVGKPSVDGSNFDTI